jgi:hypothetical protein
VDVSIIFLSFDEDASPVAVVVNPKQTIVSDGDGLVQVNLLRYGYYEATYLVDRRIKRVKIEVPNQASFTVVEPRGGTADYYA